MASGASDLNGGAYSAPHTPWLGGRGAPLPHPPRSGTTNCASSPPPPIKNSWISAPAYRQQSTWWVQCTHVHVHRWPFKHETTRLLLELSQITLPQSYKYSGLTHLILNVHINTRSGKETFHTSSMTSPCSKV